VIDESFSQIPKNIYQIHDLIDKIGQIMDEGLDPVKVLWHDALVGKGISFNG